MRRSALTATAIKFCGLTRGEDVLQACALGVDYLGLVLAAGSPRRLDLAQAGALAALARAQPAVPAIVVLLRNAPDDLVAAALAAVAPDLVQFHGDEDEATCQRAGHPYWKALGVAGVVDIQALLGGYRSAQALLLDGHAPGASGGGGVALDWSRWPRNERPLVLAGGLDPGNVGAAIAAAQPWAVDVSSGIEDSPGRKDPQRMRDFVAAVRAADAR
jgi:phosphoribosylanthranilate isomerase